MFQVSKNSIRTLTEHYGMKSPSDPRGVLVTSVTIL